MKMKPLKLSLFVIITLSICMIISGFLFYKNFIGFLGAWNQSNKMNIYLKIDTPELETNKIIDLLKQKSNVVSVKLVDRNEAGLSFQNSLKEFSSGLVTLDELVDLIPESIEVDLKPTLSLKERDDAFAALAEELKSNLAIEDVNYGATWIKKFEKIDRIIRSLGFLAFLVLLLTISYLVALMVRVYIDDSKQEIEVYSLIGATRWSIYQIFLKDIFIFLAASLVTSFVILFLMFNYVKEKLSVSGLSATFTQNLNFLSFNESTFVIFMLFIFIYANCFFTIRSSVNRLNQISND
jgi:cell division transport system permease protein